jgi:hypothetical protein
VLSIEDELHLTSYFTRLLIQVKTKFVENLSIHYLNPIYSSVFSRFIRFVKYILGKRIYLNFENLPACCSFKNLSDCNKMFSLVLNFQQSGRAFELCSFC